MFHWWATASAATLEVGPDEAFRDLPSAIEQARSGDRIEVHPGEYTGPIRLGGKALEIVSTDGSAVTRLVPIAYGDYYQTVVEIGGGAAITLRGFTVDAVGETLGLYIGDGNVTAEDLQLSGGRDRNLIVEQSTLTMVDSTFTGAVGSYGGHAQIFESDVVFERVAFTKGHSGAGGGALYVIGSTATFRSCTFADNDGSDGGALKVEGDENDLTTIEDSVFERNRAIFGYGGAVHQRGGTLSLLRTTIRANSAVAGSGGISYAGGLSFRFADGRVEGNSAPSGAGIALYDIVDTAVLRSSILGNTGPGDGGGILMYGVNQRAEIAGNRFCDNVAGGVGGAVWVDSYATLTADVHHNVFVGNTAGAGAAIAATNVVLDVSQNTIVDSVTGGNQGAVWVNVYARATLSDNAITHSDGAAAVKVPDADLLDARYTLVFANDQDLLGTASSPTTVEADPGYRGYVAGDCGSDLHPLPDGGLVDAGDPALLDDDGSRADIGAYGGPGASTLIDVDGDGAIDDDCDPYDPLAAVLTDEVVADGLDQDCDGRELCFVDSDRDGVGGEATGPAGFGCTDDGFASAAGDCDDADPERTADCATGGGPSPDPGGTALPRQWFCATGGSPSSVILAAFGAWLVRRRRR